MNPKGFIMAWVVVKDFNQAKEFFTQTLGLTLTSEAPEYNWAELSAGDGAAIGLAGDSDCSPIKAGSNAVICINVENLDEAIVELKNKNARIIGDVQEVPGHVKMLLIQDESGNHYQVVQRLD